MPAHADILDERESLKGAATRAFALHLAIAGVIVGWTAYQAATGGIERWGDPKSLGGGSVMITPVSAIPLPQKSGQVNPVANDTESQVPAPPKPQPRRAPEPDPTAVALKSKAAKAKPAPLPQYAKSMPQSPQRTGQLYSSSGQSLTSPMYSTAPGGGGVGSGSGSPFGNRFGYYEQLLRERVARNWRSQELDSRIRQKVAVTFDILRNGTIRNVRVTQSSGNFTMDQSAQRAIVMANPVDPLPREYEREVATVEFWFALQQ